VEAVAQPVGDLLGRQRPHPRGGQLDSKWNAAELLTDVRDGGRVGPGDLEIGAHLPGAVKEQAHRVGLPQRLD
jgi:hypothetical protein